MDSQRELIGDNWYYFLKASGKWHVYLWHNTIKALIKLKSDVENFSSARQYAIDFNNKYGEKLKKGVDVQ